MQDQIKSKTLAVDLGARRVGLALGDERGSLATPLEVLEVTSPENAIEQVMLAAKREGADLLVIGVPINMDDSFGESARQAVKWGRELSRRSNLNAVFVDERLSSFAADQHLADESRQGRKLTRKGKKRRQDALAAADFLQAYLDGRLKPLRFD